VARGGALLLVVFGAPAAAVLAHSSRPVDRWIRDHLAVLTVLADALPAFYPPHLMTAAVAALGLLALSVAACGVNRGGAPMPPALPASALSGSCAAFDQLVDPGERRGWRLAALALGVGWLALVLLLVRARLVVPDSPLVVASWLALMVVALQLAGVVDARFRPPSGSILVARRDLVFLLVLVVVLTAWQVSDLDSWRYSNIGDEWGVYARAASFVREGLLQPRHYFGSVAEGVYGVHSPFLSSFQAAVMAIAGESNFGWRLSGVLALTLGVIPFTLFAGRVLGRSALALALVVLCSSPLLFAEAHSGYGWGQMRLWTLCTLAALVWALDRCSLRLAVILGIFCAFCTLVHGLALFVAPLALGVYAVGLWRRSRMAVPPFEPRTASRAWVPALASTSVLVFMTVALLPRWLAPEGGSVVDGLRQTLWKTSLGPLVAYYLGGDFFDPPLGHVAGPGETLHTVCLMTVRAVLAPLTFQGSSHYVVGPVVDPIAGGLVMLGMLVTLLSATTRRRSLLIWVFFLPALVMAGTLAPYHEYGDLRVTRLHFLVPFWAIFAGFGLEAIAERLRPVLGPVVRRAGLVLLLAAVTAWNVWRIEVAIPRREEATAPAMAMRVLQESPPDTAVYACLEGWHPLGYLATTYPQSERLRMVSEEEFAELLERGPSGREVFLLRLDVSDQEARRRFADFLERYSTELGCRVLPDPERPRILRCDHPPDGESSAVHLDGRGSARIWLGR
jgi:hypothetical protein